MVNIKKKIFPLVDREIEKIVPEWRKLKTMSEGFINVHTLNVLYLVCSDPKVASLG
jgi:hypothetical protein